MLLGTDYYLFGAGGMQIHHKTVKKCMTPPPPYLLPPKGHGPPT